jgi:isochorismate hydrolase
LRQRDIDVVTHVTDSIADTSEMRHFAALKYVFLCGSRCNSAAIRVLEKVDTQWTTQNRRPCSFAMNRDNPQK